MGPQEDYIETVVTCEGDYHDPELHSRIETFRKELKDLLLTDMSKIKLKKVEPWNSVRVTFNIPKEAALRLKQLAQQGNATLRELGVLAVQIQGDQAISLTIAGRNNERTELIIRTDARVGAPSVSVFDSGLQSSDELNSPGPSNVEATRKNIADYLRQGTSIFDTLFSSATGVGVFKSPNVVATSCEPIPLHQNSMISTCPGRAGSASGQAPLFMSNNYPPGRSPTGYPASSSGSFSPPGSNQSPIGPQGIKFPSPPIMGLGQSAGSPSMEMNHMGLPPPPPYPHVAGTMNNLMRHGKGGSMSSPLLVNLLQTEPLAAGFSCLPGSKMLPPVEGGPPPKKKRRPRKPKETTAKAVSLPSEIEIPIQSVLNPALSTSVSHAGHVESPMESTQSTTVLDTNVSYSSSQHVSLPSPVGTPPISVQHQVHDSVQNDSGLNDNLSTVQGSITSLAQDHKTSVSGHDSNITNLVNEGVRMMEESDPYSPEMTAGKIINPYTGQLEPVDLLDNSPNKFATQSKNRNQKGKSTNKPSRGSDNLHHEVFVNRGKKHLNKNSAKAVRNVHSESAADTPSSMSQGAVPSDIFDRSDLRTRQLDFGNQTNCSTSQSDASPLGNTPISSSSQIVPSEATEIYASSLSSSQPRQNTSVSLPSNYPPHTGLNTSSVFTSTSPNVSRPSRMSHAPVSTLNLNHTNSIHSANSPQLQTSAATVCGNSNSPRSHLAQSVRFTKASDLHHSSHKHQAASHPVSNNQSHTGSPVSTMSLQMSRNQPLVAGDVLQERRSPGSCTSTQHNLSTSSAGLTCLATTVSGGTSSTQTTSSPLQPQSVIHPAMDSSSGKPYPKPSKNNTCVSSESPEMHNTSGKVQDSLDSAKGPSGHSPREHASPYSLLNSPTPRMAESNCLESPENKMPSEGDESSNHSGIITDIAVDHTTSSGSFIDSSTGKVYNHDSGVGSSSERSDDTPSEPGDSEYRTGQLAADADDCIKSQKLLPDCKPASKVITVGYVMDDDHNPQKEKYSVNNLPYSKDSSMGHVKNLANFVYGQRSDLHTNNMAVLHLSAKDLKHFSKSDELRNSHIDVVKNGPILTDDKLMPKEFDPERQVSCTLAGGLHTSENKHILKGADGPVDADRSVQGYETPPGFCDPRSMMNRSLGKQGSPFCMDSSVNRAPSNPCSRSSPDCISYMPVDSACDMEHGDSSEVGPRGYFPGGTDGSGDVRYQSQSPKSGLCQELVEIDAMQAVFTGGSLRGHATLPEGMKGSNITSKYSKQSSPVNVNMLNHIYAPGLPLPRRLTESVQRLVKPLPSNDHNLPQMRASKSPSSGGSKQGSNGEKSPRSAHSGARSPGANTARSARGKPHGQDIQVSNAISSVSCMKQTMLSGGMVLMNCNRTLSPGVSLPVSSPQTVMASGKQGSRCLAADAQAHSWESMNTLQQHSMPQAEDNQFQNKACLPLPTPFAHTTINHSSRVENQSNPTPDSDKADTSVDTSVPLSSSLKCNSGIGSTLQSEDSVLYATNTSLSVDTHRLKSTISCAIDHASFSSDLSKSVSSHNICADHTIGLSLGLHMSPIPSVSVSPSSAQHRHESQLPTTGSHNYVSQHSTVGLSGIVASGLTSGHSGVAGQQLLSPVTREDGPVVRNDNSSIDVPHTTSQGNGIFSRQDNTSTMCLSTPVEQLGESASRGHVQANDVGSHENHGHQNSTVGEPANCRECKSPHNNCRGDYVSNSNDQFESVGKLPVDSTSLSTDQNNGKSEDGESQGREVSPNTIMSDFTDTSAVKTSKSDIESLSKEVVKVTDTPVNITAAVDRTDPMSHLKQANSEDIVAKPTYSNTSELHESSESMAQNDTVAHKSAESVPMAESLNQFEGCTDTMQAMSGEEPATPRRITRKSKSSSESEIQETDSDGLVAKSGDASQETTPDNSSNQVQQKGRPDSIGMGLRVREIRKQGHSEDRLKSSPDELNDKLEKPLLVRKMEVPNKDEDMAWKKTTARRIKVSPPVLTEKSQSYSFFDIPIIQGRTRSQAAPEVKDSKDKEKQESPTESQKRAARPSRQKDNEQPAAKRRRSRDHR
ncbi:uncharacterized protein LOC121374149 [Gigantopelta aegis]|uniref:uncharacterized protein LOC121374149 n=1 Tax=Gigantopelta aegis TaxID=1735272 RepID=UPI001B88CBDE|nr:uncharacterized protein LOC121374149 [Gigantopelta aegis]